MKSDEAMLTSELEEKQNTINQLNRDLEELKAKKERVNKQVRNTHYNKGIVVLRRNVWRWSCIH